MSRSSDSCGCCLLERVHAAELAAFVLLIGALFASAELLRLRGVDADATRRYTHAAGASVAALLPALLSLAETVAVGAAVAAILAWTHRHGLLRSVHGVERPTLGAALFPLGLALAAIVGWAQPASYLLGTLTFALADPAAATVGERIRSPRWAVWRGTKSLGGSLAFVGVTLLIGVIASFWAPLGLIAIVAVAVILGVIEALLGFGLDNVVLPPVAVLAWRAVVGD
jgi:phytol kinase